MNNLTKLPEATKARISAMNSKEKARLLSDFEAVVAMDGFCDWVSYAFIVELRVK